MAPWLRCLERLPALAQLSPHPKRWRLVWAQSFLVYLASRQISRPGPEHAEAFFAALAASKPVPFREQVKEAAALTLTLATGAVALQFNRPARSLAKESD